MSEVSLEGAPKITLAGKEWAIPALAIKQARIVVPALLSIMPTISKIIGSIGADPASMFQAIGEMSEADYDAMLRAVFHSLKRGYPTLTLAEFDEMEINTREIFEALPTIIQQTGFLEKKDKQTPGEATAALNSTGTT